MKKEKMTGFDKFFHSITMIISGFLFFFLIWYIGTFGISNFIFESKNKWDIIVNISVWYVLVMYLSDEFFNKMDILLVRAKQE